MSITRHHNDWLSLVPNSGPFLSLPVLAQAFAQGLDAHDADHARRLRMAFDEWDDNQLSQRPDPGIHRAWIKFVLGETLGYDELLAEGQAIPQTLKSEVAEYGETLRPDWIVNDPATKNARLLVQVYPRSQSLTKPVAGRRWNAWPDGRMMQLLHDTGIRLGIVTNGDHWMLVNAPKNETTGYASWHANLWLEEPVTQRAFRTLLGADRLFSVPENETLEALLDKSANDQQEVTDQLGYQVRKAVEVLIQALDKADQEHGRKLLADVHERVLYESALTVMMRLVFLFCAEERELLLLGDDLYDENYAVSTLREQLRVTADQYGEEILGLRFDAWTRLLTAFRAVYAGAKHDRLKLPAYGGSLFNPDRFPFLEGRKFGTTWKTAEATPLPVSNRTVLHLLEALQVLRTKVGNTTEARKLSFRALDIEQIGHVYEGLLDHTAKRATEPVLGLAGTRDKEPEIALAELEKIAAKGEKELLKFLKEETGRSESALKKGLNAELEDQLTSRFRTACQDSNLWKKVKPFAGLVRLDDMDYPVVITTSSVFVTAGTDRRSSGTHYTPKSLTEPIVQYTLEPLVYVGPAEGLPKDQWKLRSAKELLDLKICDMACGSGAFLVQACRYLAARLLEAWAEAERSAQTGSQGSLFSGKAKSTVVVRITPYGLPSKGAIYEQPIPLDFDERQTYALRIVAQRCLYGVDKNPLAVEMAKLSLWLLTLAKDKPFEFLDHAIRCGDSLVGIHNLEQLRKFNLDGMGENNSLFLQFLDPKIKEAIALRRQITEMQANTVEEVEAQDRMLREANEKIDRLRCAADMLVGAEFLRWEQHELIEDELRDEEASDDDGNRPEPGWLKAKKATEQFRRAARTHAAIETAVHFHDSDLDTFHYQCQMWLNGQPTFHWPLEFPEVLVERGGFDAFMGNPPFMGGSKISGYFGDEYRSYLVSHIARNQKGNADLCAYFFLRAFDLVSASGHAGLIATNTIAQGDTREVGLEQMSRRGCVIHRAIQSSKWPGAANLEIAEVWVSRSTWKGAIHLDDQTVVGITPYLSLTGTITGPPKPLLDNEGFGYSGTYILGNGFLLTEQERQALISTAPKSAEVLQLYLSGEDFNTNPDQSASRWVVNFQDWPLDRDQHPGHKGPCASDYPELLAILEQRVRPERATNSVKSLRDNWWIFKRRTPELIAATSRLERVLFHGFTSKYVCFGFVPTGIVYAGPHIVITLPHWCCFAILQSSFHISWAFAYCSTHETRLRYAPSDLFETYPFPFKLKSLTARTLPASLEAVGEEYHQHRQRAMAHKAEGLTQTYNRFHNTDDTSADIQKLRELHVEMDNAVAAAYGWADLDLAHGFQETKQGVRYTINEVARREVLARLLKLNHERYAEEVAKGLHDKKAKRAAGKATTETASVGRSLFDIEGVDTAFPTSDRDRRLCGLLGDLVAAHPGLASEAYLDAMVIALRPKRHKRLLIGKDRTKFTTLAEKFLGASGQTNASIPWADLVDVLTQQEAVRLSETVLEIGSRFDDVRTAYPACDPKLIQLIHTAATTLREFQSPDNVETTDSQQELSEFNEDKRSLCGAMP